MGALASCAERIRQNRKPTAHENLLMQAEGEWAEQIEMMLRCYGELRDRVFEEVFHAVYGSPLLQNMVGLKASDASPRRHPGADAEHVATVARLKADLKARVNVGGPREAAIRALMFIRLADGDADERGLALLRRMRDERGGRLTLAEFKQLVRDQFFMLLLDEERALAAIPAMLAGDRQEAARIVSDIQRVNEVVGLKTKVAKMRFAKIKSLIAAVGRNPVLNAERLDEAVSAAPQTGAMPRNISAEA
jgi:hypothetical protein